MVIVQIIGGLGNQMFQYALGYTLASKHRTALKLDISTFDTYKTQNYGLHCFNTITNIATNAEILQLKGKSDGRIARRLKNIIGFKERHLTSYVKERSLAFDPSIMNLSDNTYLEGYWQNELYFSHLASEIQRCFTITSTQSDINHALAEKIFLTNSVSLHVRRGDYISNKKANAIHGLCDLDYYRRAISYLSEKVAEPHFFIFSDDPQWTFQNLKISFPATYVTHNGPEKNYEDLRLMTQCKHQIIANSSFSWWGAWLNPHKEKIVIGPERWFRSGPNRAINIMPPRWIRI